ncbi:MAG: transcription antitermination protein NusB [Crocinitomicaceae bacterium]|jgi:N utilization substance protein B|nr:transcription antitermination protein NusB [Crocinitomicaceae bacterium]
MLNRRHLRIKVLQLLYAYFQSEEDNFPKAEKELMLTIERMYDMYLYLLLSLSELKRAAENKVADKKKKIRPSEDDLHPNLKFVDNQLIKIIENSTSLNALCEKRKINWMGVENQELFRKMFQHTLENETYFDFLHNNLNGFEEDRAFALSIFKEDIANSELLYSFFEEKSINWLDDLDLCCSMVLKSLKGIKIEEEFTPMPLFKENDDEKEFVIELFRKTIINNEENEKLIAELADNWELDRIAKMDMFLLKMGLTELQIFPSIPTKVTLNEYIEISKFYSTPKSNLFINGILDKAIGKLTLAKKIVKTGRGLIN